MKDRERAEKERRALSEHKTYADDESMLGKGVFGPPLLATRLRNREVKFHFVPTSVRIGDDYQAVIPNYTSKPCRRRRNDVCIQI